MSKKRATGGVLRLEEEHRRSVFIIEEHRRPSVGYDPSSTSPHHHSNLEMIAV